MSTLYVVNSNTNIHLAFTDGYSGFSHWCKVNNLKPSVVYKTGMDGYIRVTKSQYKIFVAEKTAPVQRRKYIADHMSYGACAAQMKQDGDTNGCTIISLAVAANETYGVVAALAERIVDRKVGHGLTMQQVKKMSMALSIDMTRVQQDEIISDGATTAQVLRQLDDTKMYMIVQKHHVFTVKAGELHDWCKSGSRRRCQGVYELSHHSFI